MGVYCWSLTLIRCTSHIVSAERTQACSKRQPPWSHCLIETAGEHEQVGPVIWSAHESAGAHGIGRAYGCLCAAWSCHCCVKAALANGRCRGSLWCRGASGVIARRADISTSVVCRLTDALAQGRPLRNGPIGACGGWVAIELKRPVAQHRAVVRVCQASGIFAGA